VLTTEISELTNVVFGIEVESKIEIELDFDGKIERLESAA
jgi:hypothetical protein